MSLRIFGNMGVSASGLRGQRARMDTIAENIANAETTRTAEGGPYRRKTVIMEQREPTEPLPIQRPQPASDFGDTSVKLVVRPWCQQEDYWALRYALPEVIKDAVEAAGCSLPCPERRIRLRREEATA